jgi:hypothetical protein
VLDKPVQRLVEGVNPSYYAPTPSLPPAAPPLVSPATGTNPASNMLPAKTRFSKGGK